MHGLGYLGRILGSAAWDSLHAVVAHWYAFLATQQSVYAFLLAVQTYCRLFRLLACCLGSAVFWLQIAASFTLLSDLRILMVVSHIIAILIASWRSENCAVGIF